MISILIAAFGFPGGMARASIIAIVLGFIGLIFIRSTLQETGIYPDNVTKEVYEREYATDEEEGKDP